ncbi:BTAD domain-containing putative transcriptional regulator [Flexivirga meconopsidis]|uniref:BTAD domain-containing putative transcriptional regulator n=1 Tax=Flexivirga meconopsidis TaxID=2977121 RepID=UPI00223EF465|nr:BTAD domain-containing putative transcriptional regulator [Flexivirga meconopsidis]
MTETLMTNGWGRTSGAGRIEIGLLGPLRAGADGAELCLGGRRQQTVLAMLAMAHGRPVAVDTLADVIWGEGAPATHRTQIAICVANLRKIFAPYAAGRQTIRTVAPGYALVMDAFDLDTDGFCAGVEAARHSSRSGNIEHAIILMDRALDVWRGEAYQGFDALDIRTVAEGLAERRLDAEEERFAWLSDAGRQREALPELHEFVAAHPTRDQARWLLIDGLCAVERRVDALEQLRSYRDYLRDNLGIEPDDKFQRLQARLLTETGAPAAAPVDRPRPGGRRSEGSRPVFGREHELALLDGFWDGREGSDEPVVITGKPLVGKTTLIQGWLRGMTGLATDGVHVVGVERVEEDEVERRVLIAALRRLSPQVQVDDAPVAMLRHHVEAVLATRCTVLVLDAVPSSMLARLPRSGPDSLVIATSRSRRCGAAQVLQLRPWSREVARDYLRSHVADAQRDDDPNVLDAVLAITGGAPAVVVGVCSLLDKRPHWTVGDLAAQTEVLLREICDADAGCDAAVRSIRAHLRPASLVALEAMALRADTDLTAVDVARLVARPVGETRRALEALVDESVLHIVGRDDIGTFRYGISEVIATCARLAAPAGTALSSIPA